jgi:hypothetical protein
LISESKKARINTNKSDDGYDVPLNADNFLNNISIIPTPTNTINRYIHAFAVFRVLGERCLPHGTEQMIAAKQIPSPMLLEMVICSLNKKNADMTGIKSDKRCAISVRTIPFELIDMAIITNNAGSNRPSMV